MGGSSEKKIKRRAEEQTRYYQAVLAIVSGVFLLTHIFSGDLFTFSIIFQLLFFSAVNYFCYTRIIKQIQVGLSSDYYSTYLDFFVLNTFVQFTTCFYSGFWYFYLIVPGYGLWYVAKWCWGKTNIEYKDEDEGLSKTQQKKKAKYEKYQGQGQRKGAQQQ